MANKFNNLLALSLMVGMGAAISDVGYQSNRAVLSTKDKEERERAMKKVKEPKTKEQEARAIGLKEWNINGKIVYAATKKKAYKLALRKED